MTVIIFLCVYVLSAYGFWKYVQVAHSVNGIYEQMVDDNTTLAIIMVIPVLNTMMSVVGWICYYPKKRDHEKREMHFVKFFKIKR